MMITSASYLKKLQERAKTSHVYRKYQLLGLEIARVLQDERHKSLYIKLAREHGGEKLLKLAKEVAERQAVKNKGAYFMKVLASETAAAKPRPPRM